MNLPEVFLGYRDFMSKSEITSFIRKSKHFDAQKEDPKDAGALLIFQTSKQQTWIVSTSERLYCILDDIRKDNPNINWSMPKDAILKGNRMTLDITTREKSDKTGLVDIGSKHRNWLFTKWLFENTKIEDRIQDLIYRKMGSF